MSQIDSPWEAGATGVAELQPCLRNSRRKFINDPQGPPVSPARSRSPVLGLSHEVANCNFDIASTIFAGHRLCRSAPAAVEQNSDSLQTRRWRKFRLAHDRGEVADALVGVCPAQRSTAIVCPLVFSYEARVCGVRTPSLLTQASRPPARRQSPE